MGIPDRIYVVNCGTLLANGTPEEIRQTTRMLSARIQVEA